MVEYRWQLYPQHPDLARKIADKLNQPSVIAQILLNRDITSIAQATAFLSPKTTAYELFDEQMMASVCELIHEHQTQEKRILVYGDYDVDGIVSVSLLKQFLSTANSNIKYYIPNRFTEGYGLGDKAVEFIQNNNIDLVITVDCGISDTREIELIKSLTRAKVIVMDHHSIPDQLPNADAILNPKFLAPTHPLYYLCAAGVVYKFIEFYCRRYQLNYPFAQDLDLVAIATIADVVQMNQENRMLVAKGLDVLSHRNRLGIRILLEMIRFQSRTINARDVGFVIAPHLNAAGRLEDATIGVELLLATRHEVAEAIAIRLKNINETRQAIGRIILSEAEDQIQSAKLDHNILILFGEQWHPGVMGITASHLVKKFNRPVIMMSGFGNHHRGSARTFGDINIYQILKNCAHFFKEFGGHKEAAGFSLDPQKINEFKDHLIQKCANSITPDQLIPKLMIDYELPSKEMTVKMAEKLDVLAPYGSHHNQPIFYSNDLHAIDFKLVGASQTHLKATLTDSNGKLAIEAIGFNLGPKLALLYHDHIELAFHLTTNTWKGVTLPQLQLLDIK